MVELVEQAEIIGSVFAHEEAEHQPSVFGEEAHDIADARDRNHPGIVDRLTLGFEVTTLAERGEQVLGPLLRNDVECATVVGAALDVVGKRSPDWDGPEQAGNAVVTGAVIGARADRPLPEIEENRIERVESCEIVLVEGLVLRADRHRHVVADADDHTALVEHQRIVVAVGRLDP